METIFDKVKGVYRVYNPDGSYQTYTPAQFKELGGKVEVEEVDADIVIDDKEEEETEEEEVELGNYKLLEEIPYTDENGVEQGKAEVGSIQEVPTQLGDSWVEQGLAEKVEVTNESNTQA